MHRNSQPGYQPTSPLLRRLFAVAAVAATLATGGFIELLAQGYGVSEPVLARLPTVVVVAQR